MASSLAQPSPEAVQLADQLTDLFGRVRALEMRRALANASIDGGNLPIYDANGNLQMTVGILPDGTFGPKYYNPNPPPVPATPVVTPTWGGLTVGTFGTSADGIEWPLDVSHIEVHVSSLEVFFPSPSTLAGSVSGNGGGIYAVMGLTPGQTYWVRLVAVNTSEKKSQPSVAVSGVPGSAVSQEELEAIDQALEDAIADVVAEVGTKTGTFYNDLSKGEEEPTGTRVGDTWFRPDLGYMMFRWDGTDWMPAEFGSAAIADDAVTADQLAPGAVTVPGLDQALADTISTSSTDASAALTLGASNTNSTFAAWTGTLPDGWTAWSNGGTRTKNTADAKTSGAAVEFVTITTTGNGLQRSTALDPLPTGLKYVTVELDVMLKSGTFDGAGFLLDWAGLPAGQTRSVIRLKDQVPSPVMGKWYRVTQVLKRPTDSGAQTGWNAFVMANYDGDGFGALTAKTIIFDRVALRAATVEEITAYESPTVAQGKADAAKTAAEQAIKTLWGGAPNSTTIDGGKIRTNTILATSVQLSDWNNYWPDRYFLNGGEGSFSSGLSAQVPPAGGKAVLLTGRDHVAGRTFGAPWVAARPGDEFLVQATYKRTKTGDPVKEFAAGVWTYKADGSATTVRQPWDANRSLVGTPVDLGNGWFRGTWKSSVKPDATDTAYVALYLWINQSSTTGFTDEVAVTDVVFLKRNGADLLVDGAITTGHLAAGSITTQKLMVGSADNLLHDPTFLRELTGTSAGWNGPSTVSIDSTGSRSVQRALKITNDNTNQVTFNTAKDLPCEAGDVFNLSAWFRQVGAAMPANGAYLGGVFKLANGTQAWTEIPFPAAADGSWGRVVGKLVAPANAVVLQQVHIVSRSSNTTGTLFVDFAAVTRAATGELIVDGAITADKIKAGEVNAGHLAAGSVTAAKMTVGDFTNYAAGSDFEGTTHPWTLAVTHSVDTAQSYRGTKSLKVAAHTNRTVLGSNLNVPIQATEGDQFYVEYQVRRTADWDGDTTNTKLRFGNQTGALVWDLPFAAANVPTADTWTKRSGTFTTPAGATSLQVTLTCNAIVGTAWIDNIVIRRVAGGELIVDGAITGTKIKAGEVNAGHLAAGSVTTEKLTVGSVGDNIILNGNFADLLNGKPVGWTPETAAAGSVGATIRNGATYLNVLVGAEPAGTVYQAAGNGMIPASPGDQFHIEVGACSNAAGQQYRVGFHHYDRAGLRIGWVESGDFTTGGILADLPSAFRSSAVLAVPSGATAFVRFGIRAITANTGFDFDKYTVGKVNVSARIADGAITADKIQAKAVVAEKIAARAVRADHVEAGAITADKIQVGAKAFGVNDNANFEQEAVDPTSGVGTGQPYGWGVVWTFNSTTLGLEKASPLSGAQSARVNMLANENGRFGSLRETTFPVTAQKKWYVSARVKAVGGNPVSGQGCVVTFHTSTGDPAIWPLDLAGPSISWHNSAGKEIADGQEVTISGTFTVPNGHTRGGLSIWLGARTANGYYLVEDFVAHPAVDNSMVTDISAGKLTTGFIQAGQKILAGAAETGARLEMNSGGLFGYDANNDVTFALWGTNGSAVFRGSITGSVISGSTVYAGNTSGVHMTLSEAWGNQAALSFHYTDSGWGSGSLTAQYWLEGGTSWAAVRLTSQYNSALGADAWTKAAYLDVRSNGAGTSQLYVAASQAFFTANTFVMGSGDDSTVDFRAVQGNGFQFSDYSQVSRLRLMPQLGYFTLRAANNVGAATQIRLQGSQVVLEANGAEIHFNKHATAAPNLASEGQNSGISFNSGKVVVSAYWNNWHIPIEAAAFNVASDPRLKSDAVPVEGALAAVKSLDVYDYDMQGILPAVPDAEPQVIYEEVPGPSDAPRPRPGRARRVTPKNRARGVMADEVREILPNAVKEDENGMLSVSMYDLLATTMAAVKELSAKVDQLEANASASHKPGASGSKQP